MMNAGVLSTHNSSLRTHYRRGALLESPYEWEREFEIQCLGLNRHTERKMRLGGIAR